MPARHSRYAIGGGGGGSGGRRRVEALTCMLWGDLSYRVNLEYPHFVSVLGRVSRFFFFSFHFLVHAE